MKKYKEMERIIIDKESIDAMEEDIIIRRGIERYMYARQFVYGNVLDIASGVGYGSYLMSKNPDVKSVTGVDQSEHALENARASFGGEKVRFVLGTPETVTGDFDMLVCLETIEHLPDPKILWEMTKRCGIDELILSFPHKKTTHYNQYHLWDFTQEDIRRIFYDYECWRVYELHDSTIMNSVRSRREGYTKPRRYFGE